MAGVQFGGKGSGGGTGDDFDQIAADGGNERNGCQRDKEDVTQKRERRYSPAMRSFP